MPTTDFHAFATGTNALVLDENTFGAETWLINGFGPGIADPVSCNSVWRQSTFVAAGITQWMANTLNQNIHDDGNVTNFVTLFGACIRAGVLGGVTSFNTRKGAVTLTSTDVTNALGYTPVRTINGRNGNVILTSTDVTTALGYTPVNKGGDTMSGLLSGPNPVAISNYATKAYVDASVGGGGVVSSGIIGNVNEYTFPLGDGGFIKMGRVSPSNSIWQNSAAGILVTFLNPFPNTCSMVSMNLVSTPSSSIGNSGGTIETLYTQHEFGISGASTYQFQQLNPLPINAWGVAVMPSAFNRLNFTVNITGPWVGTNGPFPTGFSYYAIGF